MAMCQDYVQGLHTLNAFHCVNTHHALLQYEDVISNTWSQPFTFSTHVIKFPHKKFHENPVVGKFYADSWIWQNQYYLSAVICKCK
jgi:hypothetical protein